MDLDTLKQVWKDQKTENFSREQIIEMLQKKSSSIAKWIFYIGLAEFLFWFILSITTSDEEMILDNTTLQIINYFTFLNYPICLVFLYLFFRNYLKIKAQQPIKQLMKSIFSVRKTVQTYIIYNISIMLLALIISTLSIIMNTEILVKVTANSDYPTLISFLFISAIILFLGVIFTGLYFFYKLLYGVLLKKLSDNYNEIKELQ